jgi:hypothetical protein
MGLLSFLMHHKPSFSDKVWMTKPAAVKGIMTDALQCLIQGEVPVVLSFFSDKQQDIIDFIGANHIPHSFLNADTPFGIGSDKSVLLMDAQWLHASSEGFDLLVRQSRSSAVRLLFYGHYPIPEKESQLLSKVAAAAITKKICFYSSLEDRAFEMFGADHIRSLMEKMGMKEDESVEHAMVSKAMQRAREKIAGTISAEVMTATETAWYQRNYKKAD